ncbi:pygopus homolog 1 [Scleropages formosus]|uniref:Pygopus family PHD finger 1 n=1 Tax=Scleropages formosus TaxID=113540 RepID=A0A8C9VAD1_SCLFO|nr:pygopus homolog 1 [Scleropages formosus]
MSAEQDKDSLSLKRNRGGDGGLEGLGGPGVLLGSPDKKKRKSNTQASSFPPLSEYAPPPNPSADHLVAVNPFDDNYNAPSLKPTSSASPYSGYSHYPGFTSYGPHRMGPHLPPRVPSPYGGPYQMRNQLHPFAQNQMAMGFNRGPGFNYGHHDNPAYANQSFNNAMPVPPNPPYRPGPGDAFSQMPPHNISRSTNSDLGLGFGPEGSANVNVPMRPCGDPGANFGLQQNLSQPSIPVPKQDASETSARNVSHAVSPQKQGQNAEESTGRDNTIDLKPKNRAVPIGQEGTHSDTMDKLNGIISPSSESLKNSPQPCGPKEMASLERRQRRSSSSGGTGATGNKAVATPSRSGHPSADPLYPCGICLNEVKDDQEAIMCEASCQKWFHRVCTGMTETAYNLLTAEALAVWGCDTCMEDKGAQLMRTRELAGQPAVSSEG